MLVFFLLIENITIDVSPDCYLTSIVLGPACEFFLPGAQNETHHLLRDKGGVFRLKVMRPE